MPELPEVETIKRGLANKIIGLKIKSVQVLNPKTLQGNSSDIEGKKVLNVWRRAKLLGIDLSTDYGLPTTAKQEKNNGRRKTVDGGLTLLIHLKLTGQLVFVDQGKTIVGGHPTVDMRDEMPNNSTRVIFEFSDGGKLYYNDQRKFGWIKVINSSSINDNSSLKSLGPEPLEKKFTWEVLRERVGKHKNWPIKVGLMDQESISGVGNIYASEACFNAKLDPRTKAGQLSDKQWISLHRGVLKALLDGIKLGGSSRATFVNAEGKKGMFLDYAFVYQRDGEKCKICGTTIERIIQAGRSSFFCPKCQKI